jgi:hypothetical protein
MRGKSSPRDLDERVALIVLEPDVVSRAVALDEVDLEQERLADRVGHRVLEVGDPIDDAADELALTAACLLLPVAPDAVAQALGLTHIDHRPAGVLHQVHAGPVGQSRERGFEVGGHA